MKKKVTAILLLAALITALFSGCGKEKENNETTGTTGTGGTQGETQTTGQSGQSGQEPGHDTMMGRYMEKDFSLPENSYLMALRSDSSPKVYASEYKDGASIYTGYNYENGSWKAISTAWLANLDGWLETIIQGEDGALYAGITDSKDYRKRLYCSTDSGETAQEIILPILSEPFTNYRGGQSYHNYYEWNVLENGTFIMKIDENPYYSLYSQEGEELAQLETTGYSEGAVNGNKFVYMNAKGDGFNVYNAETGKNESEIPLSSTMTEGKSYQYLCLLEDGTVYRAGKDGIHRFAPGGTLWETLVDGDLNTMGMPSVSIVDFSVTQGEEDSFYILYYNSQSIELKSYQFDKNVSSAPSQILNVYSLYENSSIRQAIAMLQHSNSDVRVEYNVAMQGTEAGTASDDYIRALNTELLSGNGADLFLLDGLPVDSYIEKGVLADMSDILGPMIQNGELLANIMEPYQVGNAIYSAPLHFKVPVYASATDRIAEGITLEKLAAQSKTETVPVFLKMTEEQWIRFFLYENYDSLFKEDGSFDPQAYRTFLENVTAISDQHKTLANEGDEPGISFTPTGNSTAEVMSSAYIDFFRDLYSGKALTTANEISSSSALSILYNAIKDGKNTYGSLNGTYLPNGTIGVNAASTKKELIDEFLRILFGEELQTLDLYEGYPVNAASCEAFINKEMNVVFSITVEEDDIMMEDPTDEMKKEFIEFVKTLNRPYRVQEAVLNMLVAEGKEVLTGEKGMDEAIQALSSKIALYEAE